MFVTNQSLEHCQYGKTATKDTLTQACRTGLWLGNKGPTFPNPDGFCCLWEQACEHRKPSCQLQTPAQIHRSNPSTNKGKPSDKKREREICRCTVNVNNHSNLAEPIDEDPDFMKCMMNVTNHSDPDKKPTKQSPKKGKCMLNNCCCCG